MSESWTKKYDPVEHQEQNHSKVLQHNTFYGYNVRCFTLHSGSSRHGPAKPRLSALGKRPEMDFLWEDPLARGAFREAMAAFVPKL